MFIIPFGQPLSQPTNPLPPPALPTPLSGWQQPLFLRQNAQYTTSDLTETTFKELKNLESSHTIHFLQGLLSIKHLIDLIFKNFLNLPKDESRCICLSNLKNKIKELKNDYSLTEIEFRDATKIDKMFSVMINHMEDRKPTFKKLNKTGSPDYQEYQLEFKISNEQSSFKTPLFPFDNPFRKLSANSAFVNDYETTNAVLNIIDWCENPYDCSKDLRLTKAIDLIVSKILNKPLDPEISPLGIGSWKILFGKRLCILLANELDKERHLNFKLQNSTDACSILAQKALLILSWLHNEPVHEKNGDILGEVNYTYLNLPAGTRFSIKFNQSSFLSFDLPKHILYQIAAWDDMQVLGAFNNLDKLKHDLCNLLELIKNSYENQENICCTQEFTRFFKHLEYKLTKPMAFFTNPVQDDDLVEALTLVRNITKVGSIRPNEMLKINILVGKAKAKAPFKKTGLAYTPISFQCQELIKG